MAQDLRVENFLTREGYVWEFRPDELISRIDLVAARTNPTRMKAAYDKDRVARYAADVKAGVDFPAIVVLEVPGKPYDLLTGMHRSGGHIDGGKLTIDMYVVRETDSLRIYFLRTRLNTLEGVRSDDEETMLHAIEALHLFPHLSQTEVARQYGIPLSRLNQHKRVLEAEARADRLGVGTLLRPRPHTVRLMFNAVKNDNLFVELVKLNEDYYTVLQGRPLEGLLAAVTSCRTEQAGLDLIAERRAALDADASLHKARPKSGRRPAYVTLVRHIQALAGYLNKLDGCHLGSMSLTEVRDLHGYLANAETVVEQLAVALAEIEVTQLEEVKWRKPKPGGNASSKPISWNIPIH